MLQRLKELVIHHPMAGSRTVSEMKTFSCTSEVVISLFAQHSLMLNAIDQIVGRGGSRAELSFQSVQPIIHFSNTSMVRTPAPLATSFFSVHCSDPWHNCSEY